ncbi:MAG TPA: PRC-barrel domain-containing protein [Nitrolancea sp.]|jgi:sporulation protein YlmC with PRC-barrel domain|nr:PRC-barrel domain-containing protein [Nitrolancea sp.]
MSTYDNPETNAAPHAGMPGDTSIELGTKIVSSDGKDVGKVDSLVLDYNTREVQSIICRSGVLLTTDRIIPIGLIGTRDADGNLMLTITADEVKKQQAFVEREFRTMSPDEVGPMPVTWATGTGQAPYYFYPATDSLGYRDDAPFFSNAPLAPPDVEVESNLPENATRLDSGSDVFGSDDKKLGTVETVTYTQEGDITSFVVKAGFLFHHDVTIPAEWISSVSNDGVRLTVTADQADAAMGHA